MSPSQVSQAAPSAPSLPSTRSHRLRIRGLVFVVALSIVLWVGIVVGTIALVHGLTR